MSAVIEPIMQSAAETFAELVGLPEIPWEELNARGQGLSNPQGEYQKHVDQAFQILDGFMGNIDAAPSEWDGVYADASGTRKAFMESYNKMRRAVPNALDDPGGFLGWFAAPQLAIATLKTTVMEVVGVMNLMAQADGRGEVRAAVEYGVIEQRDAERSLGLVVSGAHALQWLGSKGLFDSFLRKPMAEPHGTHGLGQGGPAELAIVVIAGIILAIIQGIIILGIVFLIVAGIVLALGIVEVAGLCKEMQKRGATPAQISEYCIKPIADMVPNPADALKPLGSALTGLVWVAGILGGIFVLAKVAPDVVEAVKEARA